MTILQAQEDMANIVTALVKENQISEAAAEKLNDYIATASSTVTTAMQTAQDRCNEAITEALGIATSAFSEIANAIEENQSERSGAVLSLIGHPPAEFRQAAE